MTRAGRRLVEDFLLPALNDNRYGDRLKWINKAHLSFSIRWNHKNASKWSLEDTVVFQDWDKLKGHYQPQHKDYHMQAKQRFRAALYKLSTVRKLYSKDKQTKVYQLVPENDKRKLVEYIAVSSKEVPSIPKTEIPKGIPTPVICLNSNYNANKEISSAVMKREFFHCLELQETRPSVEEAEMDTKESCPEEIRMIKNENIDEKPKIFPLPHVPVQPLPAYNSHAPKLMANSQKQQKPPEENGGALNLSLKPHRSFNSNIAVAAR